MDTAVAIHVTIVGPVEVFMLNRNRRHVDGRTTELTFVERIADKIDRILFKQEQVSVDLPDRAFVRDVHIEQVMELVKGESTAEDVLNDGPVECRADLWLGVVIEHDLVLQYSIAIADVEKISFEIVGRVGRIVQATNQLSPIAEFSQICRILIVLEHLDHVDYACV